MTGMAKEDGDITREKHGARKVKRRDLLTPHPRHWHALTGTLSGTPSLGRASKRRPVIEIASFRMDSSRSYATIILLEFIVRLFQPPNAESLTVLLGLHRSSYFPYLQQDHGRDRNGSQGPSPEILCRPSAYPFSASCNSGRSTCSTSGRRTFGMGPQTRFIALGDARPTKRHGPPPYSDRARVARPTGDG